MVDVALDPLVVVMPKGGGDVGEASRFDAPVTDTNEPRLMLKNFNFPFLNFDKGLVWSGKKRLVLPV